METLPIVFDMLQYFETILPLVDLAFDVLNKMKYILQVMGYWRPVTNNSRHLGWPLGFYQELEIRLKPQEIVIF